MGERVPGVGIGSWFSRRAAISPHRRALTFEGRTWTFGELEERAERLAGALRAGGLCTGDRIAFLGLNHPAFLETLLAAARLGAIFVPLNFRLTAPELAYIVEDAGVHTLVADDAHRHLAEAIRGEVPVRRWIGSEAAAGIGWEALEELVSDGEAPEPLPPAGPDEVAVIMYTSGTTGRPKGAMLTHGNLLWSNLNLMHAADVSVDDVTLVCAPLFHIGGLNVTTLATWLKGGEIILLRTFDPAVVLDLIPRHRISTMFGVPSMFLFMSQVSGFDDADLGSIRYFICGGAPVPEPLIKLYSSRGIAFLQGYGLTETAPFSLLLAAAEALSRVGSAGVAPMFTEVTLMAESGSRVSEALARGEICIRGPNVMKGYWNRPEATREAIDERGWFHSGDIGYVDDDGFYFVVDRVKDLVITGGENVYPAEVESVLYDHPGVREVAIVGLPDERWGEVVVAVVAPVEGATVTLPGLRDFAAGSLARFKLPTHLELVDALPRNPAGKVLKFELRQRLCRAPDGSGSAEA
ncbi:MAG: acyl-CoA synthetase [Acidimicrobiia bacterium]